VKGHPDLVVWDERPPLDLTFGQNYYELMSVYH